MPRISKCSIILGVSATALALGACGGGGKAGGEGAGPDATGTGGTPATDLGAAHDAGSDAAPAADLGQTSPPFPIATATACAANPADNPPGGGHFGCWFTDEAGLPAYEYTAPPAGMPYFTRRDGAGGATDTWHQIGNYRLTASAHADGRIRVFDGTRGGKWVSPFSEYAVTAPGVSMPTAARRLVFGTGYVRSAERVGDLASQRTVFAPFGDKPMLVIEHTLQNHGAAPAEASVTETWDAGMEQILVGLTYGSAPAGADTARRQFMGRFEQRASFDLKTNAISVRTHLKDGQMAPARTDPADGDYYPGTLALASLDGTPDAFSLRKRTACEAAGCTPRTLTVANGSTTRVGPPPYGLEPGDFSAASAGPEDASADALVASLTKGVTVPPGGEVHLRFVLLYASDDEVTATLLPLVGPDGSSAPQLADTLTAWKSTSLNVDFPDGDATAKALAREIAWHGPYLLGAANYEEMYGVHAIDQGSAYGYLQGLRGAARDSLINAVAVLPLAPDMAREQIEYILGTSSPENAQISYGTSGYGKLESALVHTNPSDLDLWWLWALTEYVETTRDFDFLAKSVAFHPPAAGVSATVMERVRRSLVRLEHDIGYGPHDLLKVGSGDWSDGISFLAPDREVFTRDGESVFNSAFGAYVFRRVSQMLEGHQVDDLAAGYSAASDRLRTALASQFVGRWYVRAWDGAGGPLAADDGTDTARISLEHHAWLLVGDVPTPEQRDSVIAAIRTRLSAPSPIGTWLMYPPIDNQFLHQGWDVNGGIWAAMNGLLVWGLSRTDPQAAWDELLANSMVRHAETYPDLWYGIWSGPDAYNAAYAERPGETFYHLATPMTDYPVQNSNRHSAPLIDAWKLSGIEATPEGLHIDPRWPASVGRFSVETAVLSLDERDPAAVKGRVSFKTAGKIVLRLPFSGDRVAVRVNETDVAAQVADGFVTFDVPAGTAVPFDVRPI